MAHHVDRTHTRWLNAEHLGATMPTPFTPPLPWPVRWQCDVSTKSPYATGQAVKFASDVLFALSGRQFGLTTVVLRPSKTYSASTPFPDGWTPWPGLMWPPIGAYATGGGWGYIVGQLGTCQDVNEALLPAPINAVTQVKVDGLVVTGSAYRVDDNRRLVRTDGTAWPATNNMMLDDTQLGTWSVTVTVGQAPPDGSDIVVGQLACEYIRALEGNDCRLPKNVTNIVRQGVTISMPDPTIAFTKGLTGLPMVDAFIQTWNPGRLKSRSRTYSIDRVPIRRSGT
jgi:hypothetical protein